MACTPSAPTAAGVYWQDGKRWIAYDPQTAHQIQEALENVEKEVKIGPFNGWHFLIDLRTMTQRNVESGMETRVKVVAESNAELSPGRSSEELARRRAGGHCRLCPLLGAQRLMAQMMKRVSNYDCRKTISQIGADPPANHRTRRTFSKMDGVQNSARPSSKLT